MVGTEEWHQPPILLQTDATMNHKCRHRSSSLKIVCEQSVLSGCSLMSTTPHCAWWRSTLPPPTDVQQRLFRASVEKRLTKRNQQPSIRPFHPQKIPMLDGPVTTWFIVHNLPFGVFIKSEIPVTSSMTERNHILHWHGGSVSWMSHSSIHSSFNTSSPGTTKESLINAKPFGRKMIEYQQNCVFIKFLGSKVDQQVASTKVTSTKVEFLLQLGPCAGPFSKNYDSHSGVTNGICWRFTTSPQLLAEWDWKSLNDHSVLAGAVCSHSLNRLAYKHYPKVW